MNAVQRAIWARMPEADRERVETVPENWRGHLIELWDAAQRNERRGFRFEHREAESNEMRQDELDELLLSRATKGEYGSEAVRAVSDCANAMGHGVSRRAFIRAVRKAIEATRNGGTWKPAKTEKVQPMLPIGETADTQKRSLL